MKKTLHLLMALFTFAFASAQFTVADVSYTITSAIANGDATDEVEVSGSALATIVIPSMVNNGGVDYTVTATGKNAFLNSATLETIELPSTVTSIGEASFRAAALLTTVSFTGGISGVTNVELRGFLQSPLLTDLGALFSTLETTGGGSTNGNGAFNGIAVTGAIVLPKFTDAHGTSVLRANHNLTSVDLSDSTLLTTLNSSFLFDCDLLAEVLLPEGLVTLGGSVMRDLPVLPAVTIPSTVTTISSGALTDNPLMQTVTVLNTTPPVATGAFGGTTNIATATLKVSAVSLDAYKAADVWKDFGTIEAISTLSVTNLETTNDVNVYPNPANDVVNVEGAGENTSISIYNITGKLLLTVKGKQVNVSNLSSGVYILKITNDNREFVKRVIKK